jgi:hypothetical protein
VPRAPIERRSEALPQILRQLRGIVVIDAMASMGRSKHLFREYESGVFQSSVSRGRLERSHRLRKPGETRGIF